jgi:hypothetical protein
MTVIANIKTTETDFLNRPLSKIQPNQTLKIQTK